MSEQKFFIEYSEIGDGIYVDNISDLFDVIQGKIDLLDNEKNITAFCEAFRYFIQEYPDDLEYSEGRLKKIFEGRDELKNKINKKIEEMGGIEGFEGIEETEEIKETEETEETEEIKETEEFEGFEEFEEIKGPERIDKLNEMQNDFLNYEEKFKEFEEIIIEKNKNKKPEEEKEVPNVVRLLEMYVNYCQDKYSNEINDKFNFCHFFSNPDKDFLREGFINTIGFEEYDKIYMSKDKDSGVKQTVSTTMGKGGRTFENFSYRSNFVDREVYRNLINKIFEKAKEITTKYGCGITDALKRSIIEVKKELTEENEKGKNAEFYINRINELREKINSIDGTSIAGTLNKAFSKAVKINLKKLEDLLLETMRKYFSEDKIKTKDESDDVFEKRMIEIEEKYTALKKRIKTEDKFKEYYRTNEIEDIKNLFDSNKDYLDKKCLSEITTGRYEYKPLVIDTLGKDNTEMANLLISNGINCGNNIESIKIENKENFIENLKKVLNFEPKIGIDDNKINDLFNDDGEIDVKNKLNPLMNEITQKKTLMKDGNDIESDLNTSFNLNTSISLGGE